MKTFSKVLITLLVLCTGAAGAQTANNHDAHLATKIEMQQREKTVREKLPGNTPKMNLYVIERDVPGAGKLTQEDLKAASQHSCNVIHEMGAGIEWLHSYVADNKIFCVYRAENEDKLRKHAEIGGFQITTIYQVAGKIGPETALE
jgi:hypothetical protein